VVSDVCNDIEAQATVNAYRLVEGRIEEWHKGLNVLAFATGPKTQSRAIARRGDLSHVDIDAEIHPRAIEGILNDRGYRRLP